MPDATASRRTALFFSACMLLSLARSGNIGAGPLTPNAFGTAGISSTSHLQSLLHAAVAEGLPGVSLRVIGPGIDFEGAAGVANLNSGEPLTTDHAIYAASLGKTFTAVIVLQLCEQGYLDLESAITSWLPDEMAARISSSSDISLRHLLSHTSGLADYMNDEQAWRKAFADNPYRHWTHKSVMPYLIDRPLLFRPGSDYHYSNSNYILVGMIVERVTGQPMHNLIRERILEPLAMLRTFNGAELDPSVLRAHGYVRRHGRLLDTYPWYSHYGLADSGMHSNPDDLAIFIRSLFGTELLLSRAMQRTMTTLPASGRPPSEYGLGIYVQKNPWGAGRRWYAHDGIDPGYQADMMHLPALDLTIVIAANASMGRANSVYQKLITAVVRIALDTAADYCRLRGGMACHGA